MVSSCTICRLLGADFRQALVKSCHVRGLVCRATNVCCTCRHSLRLQGRAVRRSCRWLALLVTLQPAPCDAPADKDGLPGGIHCVGSTDWVPQSRHALNQLLLPPSRASLASCSEWVAMNASEYSRMIPFGHDRLFKVALLLTVVSWFFGTGTEGQQTPHHSAIVSGVAGQVRSFSAFRPLSFFTSEERPGSRYRGSPFQHHVLDLHRQAQRRSKRFGGWPLASPEKEKCPTAARNLLRRCLPFIAAAVKEKMSEICPDGEPADCRLKLLDVLDTGRFDTLELYSIDTAVPRDPEDVPIELLLPGPLDIRLIAFLSTFVRAGHQPTSACSALQATDILGIALCDLHATRASDRMLARAASSFGLGKTEGFFRSAARRLQVHLGGVRPKMVEVSEVLAKLMLSFLLWTLRSPRLSFFRDVLCRVGRACQSLILRMIRRIAYLPYTLDFQPGGHPPSLATAMEAYVTVLMNKRHSHLARGFANIAASYTAILLARQFATNVKITKVTALFEPREDGGETAWGTFKSAVFGK